MIKLRNKFFFIFFIILIGVTVFTFSFFSRQERGGEWLQITKEIVRQLPTAETKNDIDIEVIAKNLNIPWEVVFLPDGEILISERTGSLFLVNSNKRIVVEDVKHIGEGGLLGLTLHPDFEANRFIYLYYTYSEENGNTLNRVVRHKLADEALSNRKVIVDKIPGASLHNGGRIKFGPDNLLYITTGDAQNPSLSQDVNSLAGKILRVTDEGDKPADNPFGSLVYSYGHRNPQGLSWDDKGRLWATEHGSLAHDELNLIEAGKNYGWPIIKGDEKKEGMVAPIIHSGARVTWAPAGAVFLLADRQGFDGSIFFVGLRGQTLYEYKIAEDSIKEHFQGQYGRLRAVTLGLDGFLYVTTSNTDGRGNPKPGDDKLIKINPQIFKTTDR